MRPLVIATPARTTILRIRTYRLTLGALLLLFTCGLSVSAQDNYEIQVYGSETVPRGVTMVELDNNFTAKGDHRTPV